MDKRCCGLALLLLTVTPVSGADFSRYPPTTLAELGTKLPAEGSGAGARPGDFLIDGRMLIGRVVVRCQLETRPLDAARTRYLEHFFRSIRALHFVGLFEQEVLCREGERQYWLPIQKQLLGPFREEVSEDAPVRLFVLQPGGLHGEDGRFAPLYLINEFQASVLPLPDLAPPDLTPPTPAPPTLQPPGGGPLATH